MARLIGLAPESGSGDNVLLAGNDVTPCDTSGCGVDGGVSSVSGSENERIINVLIHNRTK